MRATIVVYVDADGTKEMIEHILDGSLAEYHPNLTVGASINSIDPILRMNSKGEIDAESSYSCGG